MKTLPEIVLPRRVPPQPSPAMHPGGDCASCSMAGALGWTVERAHAEIEAQAGGRSRNGRVILLERHADVVADVALWVSGLEYLPVGAYGLRGDHCSPAWWRWLYVALSGGWYAIAEVRHDGRPYDGTPATMIDHAVLLCGARERWEDVPAVPGARRQVLEVLVSCSASHPAGAWEDVDHLLRRGAYDAVLVRPVST